MDKANFAFTLDGKRYVMENSVLIIHDSKDGSSVLTDPEYCEYELAIRVMELLEENTKIFEKNTELREEISRLRNKCTNVEPRKYKPQFMDPPGMSGLELG